MKKLIMTASIVGLTTLGFGVVANANETIEQDTGKKIEMPNAGIKPGSKLYGMDKLFERISVSLSMSEERKTEKLIQIAEERLSELNDLDDQKLEKFAEDLYEDFGMTLDEANETLAKLLSEGDIDSEELSTIQNKLANASDLEEEIESEKIKHVNDEVKNKVKEIKSKAYAIAIASGMDKELAKELKDHGFGYGEIFKLQGIANVTEMSVEELLNLDVIKETENGEQVIDFGKLTEELGITMKDVMVKIRDVRMSLITNNKDTKPAATQSSEQSKNALNNDEKSQNKQREVRGK